MGVIRLEGIEFWAYHGVYESEKKKGNKFEVDIAVHYPFESELNDELSNTINYERIYELVSVVMAESSNLIEQVAVDIARKVQDAFKDLEKVSVKVSKFNPPIAGEVRCASAEVEL